jgi:hypothetical protein
VESNDHSDSNNGHLMVVTTTQKHLGGVH